MSSEREHDIENQPRPTCPILDAAISNAKEAEGVEENGSDIDHCIAHIEEARSNIDAIRSWGEQWKQKALQYHSEKESALQSLSNAIESINEAKDELG